MYSIKVELDTISIQNRSVYILNLDLIIFKILINRNSCLFKKSLIIRRDANSTFRSLQDLFCSKKQSEAPARMDLHGSGD